MYHWDLPQALEDKGGWPNRDLASYYADYAGILARHLGDRITIWAPFNMPWSVAYMGYGVGTLRTLPRQLRRLPQGGAYPGLAQAQALRALKAASSKAMVGSAYGMCPAYPKTDSRGGPRSGRSLSRNEQCVLSGSGDAGSVSECVCGRATV